MTIPAINFDPAAFEGMITNFSKSLTYYPVTKTTDSITGQETLTPGTSSTIRGALFLKKNMFFQMKSALLQGGDAVLLVKSDVTISKNDIVEYDDVQYRLDNVNLRTFSETSFYKFAEAFIISG